MRRVSPNSAQSKFTPCNHTDNAREVVSIKIFSLSCKTRKEKKIAGCPGTKSISDDNLIRSPSTDEMKEILDKLLDIIAKNH